MVAFGLENASTNSVFYSTREGVHPPELVLTLAAPTLPVAAYEATPRRGIDPLPVQFFDRSRGAATSFSWNFGDGSPVSSLRNPSHVYRHPGTYSVTLNVTGPGGNDVEARTDYVTVLKSEEPAGHP